MKKLTAKQLTLPLKKKARDAIVHELATMSAEAMLDDGLEGIYDMLRDGNKGFAECSDEQLLEEVKDHLESDGSLRLEAE